ncbi:MAG: hypothetical protein R3251_02040 [Candidatus Spechtbacterales bacterium]|nr:hypothetical protein [Candidatus Spechtbacterales bacterium]
MKNIILKVKDAVKNISLRVWDFASEHWKDVFMVLLAGLVVILVIDSSLIGDNLSTELIAISLIALLSLVLKPTRSLLAEAVKGLINAFALIGKQWKRSVLVATFLILAGGLFLVSEALQDTVELGPVEIEKLELTDSEQEFLVYGKCKTAADEAADKKDLRRALRACTKSEGIEPHDSIVDAYSRWKRAEVEMKFAFIEGTVNIEKLLSARALYYQVLEILPPDNPHVKDIQINIEKLRMKISEEMQKKMAKQGKGEEEIQAAIQEALDFSGDGFSEGDPNDSGY